MRANIKGTQCNRLLSALLAFVLAFGCCGGGYYLSGADTAAAADVQTSNPEIDDIVNANQTVTIGDSLTLSISARPRESTDYLKWQWQFKNGRDENSEWKDVSRNGNGEDGINVAITASYEVPTTEIGVGTFYYRCIIDEYNGSSRRRVSEEGKYSGTFTVTVKSNNPTVLPSGPTITVQPTNVEYGRDLDDAGGNQRLIQIEQQGASSSTNGKFSVMKITVKQPYNSNAIKFDKDNAKIYRKYNGDETPISASDVVVQANASGDIEFVFTSDYLNRATTGMLYAGESYVMKLVGDVPDDMSVLAQYRQDKDNRAGKKSEEISGTDDAIIPYTLYAETVTSTELAGTPLTTYAGTAQQKNLQVSMPKLAVSKAEVTGVTKTNIGSSQNYRITITNTNTNVPAKHLVVTDAPQNAYGLSIATTDVTAVKKNGTQYANAVVTASGNGFKVDFGADSELSGSDTYTIDYTMTSSSTTYFDSLRTAGKISNTTIAKADNAFAEASATLNMTILIPTASTTATNPASTVLTTNESGQVTVKFFMDGTEGVELINPTFTLAQAASTAGTATIQNAQLTVLGQQGTIDMSSGSATVNARIQRPADPSSTPIATLTYTVKAPADSTGSNGNVTVVSRMTAENLVGAAESSSTFTIAVPVATISTAVNTHTPSASSESEGVAATKVGVTVKASQSAVYAEINQPLVTIIDKASDAAHNPVATKFANLKASYDGVDLALTTYAAESDFNEAIPGIKNSDKAVAFVDAANGTVKLASGRAIAKDKFLTVTYDDEMVTGSAANTGEETLTSTIYNYSDTGNLPRSAQSQDNFILQDPSMYVGESVVEPSDAMPVINFGDSIKFKTTFNANNAAEYANAQAKDFILTINIDDILSGGHTYTPMQVGLSFSRNATIKDSSGNDVTSKYKFDWGTDQASLTITAADPAMILPYSPVSIEYTVNTNPAATYSDQIRGSDISVTSKLSASNARAEAVSPSASVKLADAALGITKKVAHQIIKKGQTDKYTITVSNVYVDSTSKARGVTVTDELDAAAVKFGYALDRSSMTVKMGSTDITGQVSVKWNKSKGFTLTTTQDLIKGANLVVTYNATTKGIPSGAYSQDLTNVAIAEAANAKPVVAMRTVLFNGAVAEDEVPSTSGDLLPSSPSTTTDQPQPSTGDNSGAADGNNGGTTDGNNAGDAPAGSVPSAGDGTAADQQNGAPAPAVAAPAGQPNASTGTPNSNANGGKSGSPTGMQSTGDELPYVAIGAVIVALLAAGAVAIARRKRQ